MAYFFLLRQIWRYAEGDRFKIPAYIVIHLLSYLGGLARPLILAQILNTLQRNPADLMAQTGTWMLVWVGCYFWSTLLHRLGRYMEAHTSYQVERNFRRDAYRQITHLPLKWHNDHHSGDTINRLNTAASALRVFADKQFEYMGYVMGFWGPLAALLVLSWQVAAMALAMAVLTIATVKFFDGKLVPLYKAQNSAYHRISAAFFDYISNIKTIISLKLGAPTEAELTQRLDDAYPPYMEAEAKINSLKWFFVSTLGFTLEAGVIFYYIWLQHASGSVVMAGSLVAVFQYLQSLNGSFHNIAHQYQAIVNMKINVDTASPILDEMRDTVLEAPRQPDWQRIVVRGLDFAHTAERATLVDVALDIGRGKRIALVGESGSGKSSLLAVLRHLYAADRATVAVDGQPADLAQVAALATLIPQEPELFENTIRYNIALDLPYSDDEIDAVVKLSTFDRLLGQLPRGLDTDIRERGVSLSGGERQRLALARGLLAARDSSILLLDEPTSSVDAANETTVYENILSQFAGCAIIAALHRLHLLAKFDYVIVMDQGRIVQQGDFETLKNESGPFQDLWRRYQAEPVD